MVKNIKAGTNPVGGVGGLEYADYPLERGTSIKKVINCIWY